MGIIKCYIITQKDCERYYYMKNAIKPFENIIDFEFVFNEDINLVQLITSYFIKFFPYNNFSNKLYNFTDNCYYKGTLECMYGHYLVYKKMLEDNLDKAIVLEDNVSFCFDFDIKIKDTLENIKEDWDIIHLFSTKPYEEHLERIKYTENIYYGDREWYTAKGQIISSRFANTFVNLIPFFEVADGITMIPSLHYYNTNLKSFTCYPYLVNINRTFKSTRLTKDNTLKENLVEFIKIPNNKHIYMLYYDNVYSYNNLSVYLHIMCGIFLKIDDKYILTHNIYEKKNLDNLNINYKIPTPNNIINKPNTIILINGCENRTNSDFIFDIKNDKYIIFYLFETIFPTYRHNVINNNFNTIIKNLENTSFSIMD